MEIEHWFSIHRRQEDHILENKKRSQRKRISFQTSTLDVVFDSSVQQTTENHVTHGETTCSEPEPAGTTENRNRLAGTSILRLETQTAKQRGLQCLW